MSNVLEFSVFVIQQFIKTDCFIFISVSMTLFLIARALRYMISGKGGEK